MNVDFRIRAASVEDNWTIQPDVPAVPESWVFNDINTYKKQLMSNKSTVELSLYSAENTAS